MITPCYFRTYKDQNANLYADFLYSQTNRPKATVQIIESRTCWQKILLILKKYLFRNVVTLEDQHHFKIDVSKSNLNSLLFQHLHVKVTKNYKQHVNELCKKLFSNSQLTTIMLSPPTTASFADPGSLIKAYPKQSGQQTDSSDETYEGSNYTLSNKNNEPAFQQVSQPNLISLPAGQMFVFTGQDEASDESLSGSSSSFHSSNKGSNDQSGPALNVHELLTFASQAQNERILTVAEKFLDACDKTCYNSAGELNNHVELKKALVNPWGTLKISPKSLRAKADETVDPIAKADLLKDADELQKEFEENTANFQKTFFPCRAAHNTVTLDQMVTDATNEFGTSLPLYLVAKRGSADMINKYQFEDIIKILDSGLGVSFATNIEQAKGLANNQMDIIQCRVFPGKIAKILNDAAFWELIIYFEEMAKAYTSESEAAIVAELLAQGLSQNERSAVQSQLRNKMVNRFFTKLGYDCLFSPNPLLGPPYFNVLHPSRSNIKIG